MLRFHSSLTAAFLSLCLCLVASGQPARAEAARDPESELKAALAHEPLEPQKILSAILGEAGHFHSTTEAVEVGFSVEVLGLKPDGTDFRMVADCGPTGFRSLEFKGPGDLTLRHNADVMKTENKNWVLQQGGVVRLHWTAVDTPAPASPPSETPEIDVSVAGMLQGGTEWRDVAFAAGRSELRATNAGGETLIVVLRTPHDAERYGSLISHASIWRDGQRTRELRRPIRGDSDQRLPRWGKSQFENWMVSNPFGLPFLWPNNKVSTKFNEWFLQGDSKTPMRDLSLGSAFCILFDAATTLQRSRSTSSNYSKAGEAYFLNGPNSLPLVVSTMHIGRQMHKAEKRIVPVNDDVAVTWWQFESETSLSSLNPFVAYLTSLIEERQELDLSVRVENSAAVGVIGRPVARSIPKASETKSPLLDSIWNSRREFPCSPAETEAAVHAINNSSDGEEARWVFVETLLRLDRLEQAPPEALARWWNRKVYSVGAGVQIPQSEVSKLTAEKDSKDAKDAKDTIAKGVEDLKKGWTLGGGETLQNYTDQRRWNAIWLMSRYPTGRGVLRQELGRTKHFSSQNMIWQALHLRAESARKAERFDFMPRTECDEILALPEVEARGVDKSAGTARPFPTDDPQS